MAEAARGFAASALHLPRRVGRRVLLKLAARGGMGDVYLAATMGIEGAERPCIVKTVRRDHIHDGSFLARFLDEARVQAQLQHPGVAQVLEAATDDDGEPYTVVEYVEGRSLADVRQRAIQTGATISWVDAAAVAIEVAQALSHVHERSGPDGSPLGIVHRDLSPQNVMVGHAGEIKLIDFGTARAHNRRCHTVAGVVFAKPGYVAPEVARQQVGDGRIDLYALGIILWELCAGQRFLRMDPQRHLDDVAAGRVILPPIAKACGAPPEIDDVIAKLTKNDPDERYARASLVVPDVAQLLASAPAGQTGERGVRARASVLMRTLWPHEPARARAEFVRLLRDAREALADDRRAGHAPGSESTVLTAATVRQKSPMEPAQLAGTPYRLVRTIGAGASGVVWEAEHVELGRRVAVKLLAQDLASSKRSLESFRREARAVARLSHPNLVRILDFGTSEDGRVFLAMDLLSGETLDAKLRGGAMSAVEATRIAIEVCRALAAAHAAGLVHRDIKPQNLMLTADGEVKLLDFGVVLAVGDGVEGRPSSPKERALRGFAVFGTPEYMAPEQVCGGAIDPRTDVYALGCVLYQMLAGVPPFDGSPVVVMGKQVRDSPRSPRALSLGSGPSAELEAVLLRAMEKAPESRFPSASAMASALEDALRAPVRRREHARRFASGVLVAIGMLAAAGASAHFTRTHIAALERASLAPAATPTPAPLAPVALSIPPPLPVAPTGPPDPPAPPRPPRDVARSRLERARRPEGRPPTEHITLSLATRPL